MRVLLIDDEEFLVKMIKDAIMEEYSDIEVETATRSDEALAKLDMVRFDAVITDYAMFGGGLAIPKKCAELKVPCLLNTGYSEEELPTLPKGTTFTDKVGCLVNVIAFLSGNFKKPRQS